MFSALRSARRLTALMSIALMLIGIMASGQARAAHVGGLLSMASPPCHHALDNGSALTPTASMLDQCLALCLTQAPDAAVVPAAFSNDTLVVSIITSAPEVPTARLDIRPRAQYKIRAAPVGAPRPSLPHAPQRLLI